MYIVTLCTNQQISLPPTRRGCRLVAVYLVWSNCPRSSSARISESVEGLLTILVNPAVIGPAPRPTGDDPIISQSKSPYCRAPLDEPRHRDGNERRPDGDLRRSSSSHRYPHDGITLETIYFKCHPSFAINHTLIGKKIPPRHPSKLLDSRRFTPGYLNPKSVPSSNRGDHHGVSSILH